MFNKKIRVAHIVPSLDIGGVEIGILKSRIALQDKLDYRVFFVKKEGSLTVTQLSVFRLLFEILKGSWKPDVVITSLWWSHPFGWLLRSRNRTWIAFFHSAAYAHSIDRIIQKWAWRNADKCIVDSNATAKILQNIVTRCCEIIPFIFPYESTNKAWKNRSIDIAWVGRNSTVKRLDLFLLLMRNLKPLMPQCRAVIVIAGPANSDLLNLSIESDGQVEVIQNADNETVMRILEDSRFYVLTSDREGMSMSTVEAIQSGCLPVVRPVGEIASYVNHDCGVLIDNISREGLLLVAETVAALNQDPEKASEMQGRAQHAINILPKYTQSLIDVCNSVRAKN